MENKLVATTGRGCWVGELGEGGQKVQTSSYKMSKLWGYNVRHGD